MKIVELLNAAPVLKQLTDRKMPAKLAYGLAKNIRLINQELEDYDKARLSLLGAHWTLDQKTGKYDIPDDDQEKWKKMYDELIQGETGYQPYKVDFSLCENIEMTPWEILTLSFIFDNLDLDPPGLVSDLESE